MKNLILLTVIFVSFFGKVLGNSAEDKFETVLRTCNKSIHFVVNDKIYLNPEMILFYDDNFM